MTRHDEWAAAYGDFGQQPQLQLTQLPLDILDAWQGISGEQQPFKLYSEEKLNELAESIRQHGIIEPICVRLKPDSRFEIIAGHNRVAAAKIAGLRTVPANVQTLDDTQAALMLVDSNLQHRDILLPSEKAFAYKLRLDCLKRQGQRTDLTSSQIETKLGICAEDLKRPVDPNHGPTTEILLPFAPEYVFFRIGSPVKSIINIPRLSLVQVFFTQIPCLF